MCPIVEGLVGYISGYVLAGGAACLAPIAHVVAPVADLRLLVEHQRRLAVEQVGHSWGGNPASMLSQL